MKRVVIPANAGQRAIADIIENSIVEEYTALGGIKPSSVRTIEDVTYQDNLIDIKTRDIDRDFSMPNLISVDRAMKNKDKTIIYDFIEYRVFESTDGIVFDAEAVITHREQRALHTLCFSCLSIQNLGLGQLQIRNHRIPQYQGSKEDWYAQLRIEMNKFYRKQIDKFQKLIKDEEYTIQDNRMGDLKFTTAGEYMESFEHNQ